MGASSYLYTFGTTRILIDAGTRPGLLGEVSLPDLSLLRESLDAVLLTHAHSDHIGALPLVRKLAPKARLYATNATLKIAYAMLLDSAKIQKSQNAVLYSSQEAAHATTGANVVTPLEPFNVGDVRVTPLPAGHVLGAVSYLLEMEETRILHSGDVNNVAGYTTPPFYLPDDVESVDAVILESTYGDTVSHVSRKSEVRRFVTDVAEVLEGGGRVLVPAFALGRSTEVALTLADHMQNGLLPKVPIVLDGLVRTVHELYAGELFGELPEALKNRNQNSGHNPLYPETLVSVASQRERAKLIRSKEPMIVIASSGMLTAGVSPLYAREIIKDERNLLAFVGYQDEGAPGRKLLERTRGDKTIFLPARDYASKELDELEVSSNVNAYSFSGHADANGLVALAKRYRPRRVLLVHGEGNARAALAGLLKKSAQARRPVNGETIDLTAPTPLENRIAKREAFLQSSETKAKRRTRTRRFGSPAELELKGNTLTVTFPEDVDLQHLIGDAATFRAEFEVGARVKIKLSERRKARAVKGGVARSDDDGEATERVGTD